jgi:type IV pilus assembly protein PilA
MASTHHPQPTGRRPPRPRRMAPPSKGMAIASLVLGIIGLPTAGLLGLGAIIGIILGIVALVRANQTPAIYGGKGLAIGGIVANCISLALIPVIGIIAAIAIPSLMRARVSANESVAIGDLRTVISAQAAYASANGGFYDTLECLGNPYESCVPNYPTTAPKFLGPEIAGASVKSGYVRTFHPGSQPQLTAQQAAAVSPTSMESYAYVAVPEQPQASGVRAFCGDQTGRICVFSDGKAPVITQGNCPVDCEPLQ